MSYRIVKGSDEALANDTTAFGETGFEDARGVDEKRATKGLETLTRPACLQN